MDLERDEHFAEWFAAGARAIYETSRWGVLDIEAKREWHLRVQQRHKLHPVITYIVDQGCRPADWHQLLLEWPAISTEDETLIAYTRDEAKGIADVRTRTSVGKYLSRHWPHVPDHIRRDWAGLFVPSIYKVDTTKEGIIAGIECGPRSCMQSGHGTIPFNADDNEMLLAFMGATPGHGADRDAVPWHKHPYAVYDPKYGWGMATRSDPGKPNIVLGRALVLDTQIDGKPKKGFVRSYSRNPNGDASNSGSDEKLEAWLRHRGFDDWEQWPDGAKLAKLPHPGGDSDFMVPYIDGGTQEVRAEESYLVIDACGKCACTNTDGTYDGAEADTYGVCEDCDGTVYEQDEDRLWAGQNEDRLVGGCCSHNYEHVWGSNGRGGCTEYVVHKNDVVEVDGSNYDINNLPDSIVMCADGEYRHIDNTVFINDEHYDADSDEVVCCEDGEYRLCDECWACPITHEWFPDDNDGIEVDCTKYSEAGLIKAIEQYQGE